jgi:hypothetical protein
MSILEVKEFLRREESSYLTIADIVKMKPGETDRGVVYRS